jgi:hypothetical protein
MKKSLLFFSLLMANYLSAQQYVNGNLSTGTISNNGTVAPAGYTWSELQNNVGETTITNIQSGWGMDSGTLKNSFADDFVIPTGQMWTINNMEFYVYPSIPTATLPVSALRIEIWNGDPSLGTSTKLYGDLTTNVLDVANSGNAFMYAIGNTNFVSPCSPSDLRKIWKIRGNANVTLNPGTYWILFQPLRAGSLSEELVVPLNKYVGTRGGATNSGAKCYQGGDFSWFIIRDPGCPNQLPHIPQDLPFKINYTLTLNTNEVVAPARVILYPNPVENSFTIEMENVLQSTTKTLTMFDVRGLKVYEAKINAENNLTFDISQLNKGVYFMKLMDDGQVIYNTKVIKE